MSGTITISEKYVRKYDQQSAGRATLVQQTTTTDLTSEQVIKLDTAYDERHQWDGGATNLVAATGRASLELNTYYGQLASANTWLAIQTISSGTDAQLILERGTTSALSLRTAVTVATLETTSDTPLRFGVNSSEVMRLHSGGVSIGKATLTTGYALDVDGKGIFQDDLDVKGNIEAEITHGGGIYIEPDADNTIGALYIGSKTSAGVYQQWRISSQRVTGQHLRILDITNTKTALEIEKDTVAAHWFGDVRHNDFSLTTDFTGTNWEATALGDFNIRNLVVRESARFRELIIDQLSVIAGSTLLSAARGKIESISGSTVTLEDPNDTNSCQFAINDFFWIKSIDVDGGVFLDLKGQVTGVTDNVLTLDTTVAGGTHAGGTTNLSALTGGEVIVQRGHPTTAARQNLIYTTVSDNDAPVSKYFTGINSLVAFDTVTNIKLQTGNMTNAPDVAGVTPTGMGIYSENAYLEGTIVANSGLIGGWTIDSYGLSYDIAADEHLKILTTQTGNYGQGFQMYRGNAAISEGDVKIVGIGQIRDKDTNGSFTSGDYGFEVITLEAGTTYKHAVRMGGSEAMIAGWDIGSDEISKVDGVNKTILSSEHQYLAFLRNDNERVKLGIDTITGLSTLISNSGQQTENPAFSQSHTTAYGTFQNDSATFAVTASALINTFCFLEYTPDPLATEPGTVSITGDVILLDDADVVLRTIGSFSFIWSEAAPREEWIMVSDNVGIGTYKLRYDYIITDESEDSGFTPRPGTFDLGGSGDDHRVEWYDNANHGTHVGRNGMYSFWGENSYFYLAPGGSGQYDDAQMIFKGHFVLTPPQDGGFLRTRNNTLSISDRGSTTGVNFDILDEGEGFNWGGYLRIYSDGTRKYLILE